MAVESFLRNPEIRRSLGVYLLLTLVITGAGFAFGSVAAGIFALGICLLFSLAHFFFTYQRYRELADLSHEIDSILHGKVAIHLDAYAEGELAILQSEIYKLTVQLREQAEALRQDKVFLADSIADISHQIRTPLTSINLLLSRLAKPELPAEQRMALIKELEMLLSRIDWLIDALLKLAKLDAGMAILQNKPVSVRELVRRAAATIAIPMDLREQQLEIAMNGDETFTGDLAWSVEAVVNILKNCMEHTPERGTISISAQENAIYTEIAIRDNGCGIAPEDLPHLFERFYKGKNASSQSVGIGLALARMIVSSQNGTIKAENNPNGGAKFTIRFYKGAV